MKSRYATTLAALLAATLSFLLFSSAFGAEKTLKAGETWEVSKTTSLTGLIIGDRAGIKAPDGLQRDHDG